MTNRIEKLLEPDADGYNTSYATRRLCELLLLAEEALKFWDMEYEDDKTRETLKQIAEFKDDHESK